VRLDQQLYCRALPLLAQIHNMRRAPTSHGHSAAVTTGSLTSTLPSVCNPIATLKQVTKSCVRSIAPFGGVVSSQPPPSALCIRPHLKQICQCGSSAAGAVAAIHQDRLPSDPPARCRGNGQRVRIRYFSCTAPSSIAIRTGCTAFMIFAGRKPGTRQMHCHRVECVPMTKRSAPHLEHRHGLMWQRTVGGQEHDEGHHVLRFRQVPRHRSCTLHLRVPAARY
jgi:hypothetical protein